VTFEVSIQAFGMHKIVEATSSVNGGQMRAHLSTLSATEIVKDRCRHSFGPFDRDSRCTDYN